MARILVVDDSNIARIRVKKAVQEVGHEIVGEAQNGVQALNMFSKLRPDLVTLDITMPIMDGIATLKRILDIDSKAKVVMISALGQQLMVLESIKSGARHFVVKPFGEANLIKIINDVLEVEAIPVKTAPEKNSSIGNEANKSNEDFNIQNISGTFIIDMPGEIKPEQLEKFKIAMDGLVYVKPLKVIFDFDHIEFMRVDDLKFLDRIISSLRNAGGDITIASMSEKFTEYLKSLALEQFKVIKTEY